VMAPALAAARGARGVRRRERTRREDRGGDGPETAEEDVALFDALRRWRAGEAKARGVPAFVVFSDATLADVARVRPVTEDALLDVKGVGPKKLEEFGAALLEVVRAAERAA
jgi:ATP-dependent DNA helicase RecQ